MLLLMKVFDLELNSTLCSNKSLISDCIIQDPYKVLWFLELIQEIFQV